VPLVRPQDNLAERRPRAAWAAPGTPSWARHTGPVVQGVHPQIAKNVCQGGLPLWTRTSAPAFPAQLVAGAGCVPRVPPAFASQGSLRAVARARGLLVTRVRLERLPFHVAHVTLVHLEGGAQNPSSPPPLWACVCACLDTAHSLVCQQSQELHVLLNPPQFDWNSF
jgi:hypothetical protein